jgi:hypothetical protein
VARDMISNEDASSGLTILPNQAPRRRGTKATALTAAALLVGTAGVATALFRSTTSDRDPATLIPANAFAVAAADLSLPGGQDGALETLLGRFPGLKLTGDGSIRDRLLRTMLHSAQPGIDYDADVKPWLGDRVAVAGWTDKGKPEMEVLLQSTDDGSARQHLTKLLDGSSNVVIQDGYAVLGNSQQAVQDALAAAGQSSLHDSGPYDGDVNALPDNQAITAWIDGPNAKEALASAIPGGMGSAMMGLAPFGMLSAGSNDVFKGRLAVGVRVTDTVAEIDARSVGSSSTSSAPTTMLTTLPSGTVGALEIANPGALVDGVSSLVKVFSSFASSSSSCYGFASALPVPGAVPALAPGSLRRELEKSVPKNIPHRQAFIRKLLRSERRAMAQAPGTNSGPTSVSRSECTPGPQPQPSDPMAAVQKALGISFPDDVKTVLGQRAVVAFGGMELAGVPDVAIRTHPTDLSAAQSLANSLSSSVSSSTPLHIDVSTAGDDLVLATSSSYGQDIAKGGDLGGQSQVKTALGDMPDTVSAAGYVDLSRIWPLIGDGVPAGLKHVHAVGFWGATDGTVQTGQLRVVFG